MPRNSDRRDESEFDDLYRGMWPRAVQSAQRILGDPGLAEQTAQEAFVRAFDRWRFVRRHPAPEAWVLRVTTNLALDAVRRKPPEFAAPESIHIDDMVVNTLVIRAALEQLSRKQRAALVLRYFAGCDEPEIAAALETSQGTVKTHLARGTRRLRELLDEDDGITDAATP